MKFFKPEDFDSINCFDHLFVQAAELANAKIAKEGVPVYGSPTGRSHTYVAGQIWSCHDDKTNRDTHKALLINIEPIVFKEAPASGS